MIVMNILSPDTRIPGRLQRHAGRAAGSAAALFEGGAVSKVEGSDLLIWEATGSDNRCYSRSFTSTSLGGQWQPLAATESSPFTRTNNVSFPGGAYASLSVELADFKLAVI